MNSIKKKLLTLFLATVLVTSSITPIMNNTTIVQAATIKISKKTLSLDVGDAKTLIITGTNKKVTWSSNRKSVATVSSKGKVTANSSGDAIITATVGGKKCICKVTVVDAVSSATED